MVVLLTICRIVPTWHDLIKVDGTFLDVVGMKITIMQSLLYLWSWNTTLCRNSLYTCMLAFLTVSSTYLRCHAITALVLHLIAERNQSLSKFCVHYKTYFDVELYNLKGAASIWIQEPYHFYYKISKLMYINIFLICKYERHLTNTFAQWKPAASWLQQSDSE